MARSNIVLTLCAITASVATTEVLLWAAPIDDPVPFDRTIRFHKLLPTWNVWENHLSSTLRRTLPFSIQFQTGRLIGVESTVATVTVNSHGFLYDERKSTRRAHGELRIALIGGSTIECIALQEDRRIASKLERYLSANLPGRTVTVLNLGISAQDSRQHVSTLAHHAVNLEIDLVVFLLGANDMYRVGEEPASGIGNPILTRSALSASWTTWLLTRSQLGRRLYQVRGAFSGDPNARSSSVEPESYIAEPARARQQLPSQLRAPPFQQTMLDEYGRVITTLNGIAAAHHIKALFLTQPSLWKKENSAEEEQVMWLATYKARGVTYKLPPSVALEMLDQVNSRLRSECAARGLWCVDLAAQIGSTLKNYYDDLHYNENGAQAVATRIGLAIEKELRRVQGQ